MFLEEDHQIKSEKKDIINKVSTTPWQVTWLVVVVVSFIAGIAGSLFSQGYLFNGNLKNNYFSLNNNQATSQKLAVQEESATTEAVKKVSPSVVSIIVSKDLSNINNQTGPNIFPFDFFNQGSPFNFFFEPQGNSQQPAPQGKQEIGGGTGFVINKDKGLILTNRHVVEDTEADYTVLTNNGNKYDAQVVARDTVNDMALVQITNHDLPQVALGDSDNVELGQTVIAIGNALGEYRNTITKGVISGINRNIVAGDGQGSSESLEGVFQTDAAINPGNSGGPLVDLAGQVIGINTAVSRQGQLIGFAIPINEVKRMISSYETYGKIVRPLLGVRYITVTPEVAKDKSLDVDYGALIVKGQQEGEVAVVADGPADKAGLVENDIILEVDGQKVDQEHSLVKIISKYAPGDTVTLKVYHQGEQKQVIVKLEEFKESQ
ncbi:MAG: trypsin-like peptidase domain-containing protein [Patescibacteria group bacterium]